MVTRREGTLRRSPSSATRDLEEEGCEESIVEGDEVWMVIPRYPGRKLRGVGPLTRNAVQIDSILYGSGLS